MSTNPVIEFFHEILKIDNDEAIGKLIASGWSRTEYLFTTPPLITQLKDWGFLMKERIIIQNYCKYQVK